MTSTQMVDQVGKTYSRLTILSFIKKRDKDNHSRVYAHCICECGTNKDVQYLAVIRGNTRSCGCIRKEQSRLRGHLSTTHGMTDTKVYKRWADIKTRCYNTKRIQYPDYGGRGIVMCDEWKNNFMSFYEWAMDNGFEPSLEIDRIDNTGNYEPGNCRWSTRRENLKNKRTRKDTVYITYNGATQKLTDILDKKRLSYNTYFYRIKRGWSISQAIDTPARPAKLTYADRLAYQRKWRKNYAKSNPEKVRSYNKAWRCNKMKDVPYL